MKQKNKFSIADLRLIADYLAATRNEITLDRHQVINAGLDPDKTVKIPRPAKWINKVGKVNLTTRIAYQAIYFIWNLIGPAFFFLEEKRYKSSKPAPYYIDNAGGQTLALSQRCSDIVRKDNIGKYPHQWLELPWLRIKIKDSDLDILKATDLIHSIDYKRIIKLCLYSHHILNSREEFKGCGLQSYTAWKWFFTRLAIDKLPGPFLMVHHFDRWAVLVDRSVRAARIRNTRRTLTLMQHGSVNAETKEQSLNINLPTRLCAVSELYVYSEKNKEIFTKEVLTASSKITNTNYYQPKIFLTQMHSKPVPTVLFVGHPFCEDSQVLIVHQLSKKHDAIFYYKPHPAAANSNKINKAPWVVIKDKTVYPKVDFIVSYPSTLIDEYANHDIPAIIHPMRVAADQISELEKSISLTLSSTATSKPNTHNQP